MPKVVPFDRNDKQAGWMFECPGCRGYHVVDDRWLFNGDVNAPTFHPSINNRIDYAEPTRSPMICHLWVTNGKLQFINDCTHELAGQTIPMPDYPDLTPPL